MAVETRPDVAIKFLKALAPDGPWKLTALPVEQRGAPTATFGPDREVAAEKWIERQNQSGANCYFELQLSYPRAASKKSNQKTNRDMRAARVLAVDVDCGPGSVEEVLRRCREGLGAGVPAPTLFVASGGGVWPIWLLSEPTEDLDRVEAIQQGLIAALAHLPKDSGEKGADRSCYNIDRIARLPGTTNIPDQKKREAGRTEALAGWGVPTADGKPVRYTLDNFKSFVATDPGRSGRAKEATGTGAFSSPVPVAELTALGLDPDNGDWLAAMIVTGHPKETVELGGDTSARPTKGRGFDRSDVVIAVACELVRRGVEPAKIAGTLLNPEWGISAHVLEQKPPDRYAVRQAQRAIELVEEAAEAAVNGDIPPSDPAGALDWLNRRHFVIEVDGQNCVVGSLVPSAISPGRTELKVQSFTAFSQRYQNRMVKVGVDKAGEPVWTPLGKFWLGHPSRRQFLQVTFRPGGEPVVDGCYNLWQGFGVEAQTGDWSRMRAHIHEVLADGDAAVADYIERWAAYAVQNLAGPQGVILAFRGGKGSGKGTFGRAFAELFGQHGLHITSSDLLTGRFTGHLEDCCLLFADEAIHPGDREAESRLKGLVTEPVLTLEAKGRDARPARNHLKIVMASNDEWVAPASWDERRYAVFDVSPLRVGDKQYFADLNAELKNGGLAAMLADLLALDLGDWRPGDAIPDTAALRAQKDLSLPPEEAWLLSILERGEMPGERPEHFGPYCRPSKYRLGRDGGLFEDMRRSGRGLADASDQKLGRFLGRWLDPYTTGQARGWRFPALADLRARWEAKHGPREWPAGVEEWPSEAFADEVARDLPF